MAKSIRSKSRRKSRSEFRRTIGTVAYNESMAKIQQKLKESLEKQSMTCIDRLAKALGTSSADDANNININPADALLSVAAPSNDDSNMELESSSSSSNSKNAIDACDSMTPQVAIVQEQEEAATGDARLFKGENKAVIRGKKWKRNKLALVSARQKQQQQQQQATGAAASSGRSSSNGRPKPRFFCKF